MNFRRNRVTILSGTFIIILACLAIVGKSFQVQSFAVYLPGVISMKFNSALFFLLSGTALLLLDHPKTRIFVTLLSLLVLLGGAATLAEYIFHVNLGIDEIFYKPATVKTTDPFPARPSSVAAFNFILISIALLLIRVKRVHYLVWVLLQLVFLVSVLAFISYAFSIATPNSFASFTMLILHTAVMFMVLCAAIFYSDTLKDLRISFTAKLVAGFVLILLILTIVFLIYKANGDNFKKVAERVSHTNEVLNESAEGLSSLISASAAMNSYLLTGSSQYTQAYQAQKVNAFFHLERLKKLVSDNAQQKVKADSVGHQLTVIFALAAQLMEPGKNLADRRQASAMIVQITSLVDRTRNYYNEIQSGEKRLLADRTNTNRTNVNNAQRIFYFFGFLMPAILLILGVIIFRNVSARKKAEKNAKELALTLEKRVAERTDELLKSEHRFQQTLDNMMEGAQLIDFEWKYVYVNKALLQHAGRTKEQLIGHTMMENYPGIDKTEMFGVYKQCLEERIPVQMENQFTFPDGSAGWFELSFQPVPDGMFILSVDITERKRSESNVRNLNADIATREKRFRTIIESSNDIISLSDEHFVPFYRTPSAARITGWRDEDRDTAGSVIDRTHPDDLEKFKADIMYSFQNPGLPVPVSIRSRTKSGGYIWLEGFITNMLEDEALGAIVTNLQDVSLRKESEHAIAALNAGLEDKVNEKTAQLQESIHELRSTQQQLVQQAKLASLGELTAGIAHEIQNPLNFVNNFAELNLELIGEIKALTGDTNPEVNDLITDIGDNSGKILFHGKRADNIVKSMLQHSRRNAGNKEPTDINALADEYLRLSYHGLRAKDKSFNAKFDMSGDPAVGKVNVVPQDMGRVLLNLINNAFHAVAEKKKSGEPGYEPAVWVSTKRINDSRIEVSIRDNGTGMPEHVKEKILQPFFTTKPTGQGTGLGLSISNDIITQLHNGELKVVTEDGQGTEFIISLPV